MLVLVFTETYLKLMNRSYVVIQVTLLLKRIATLFTCVYFFSSVDSLVLLQVVIVLKAFATYFTFARPVLFMDISNVCP